MKGTEMELKQIRVKKAIATATQFELVCPYKACGIKIGLDYAKKGQIIDCHNCRKQIKIAKVV